MNRTILVDLEAKVLALRAFPAKLRDRGAGDLFADVVARFETEAHHGAARFHRTQSRTTVPAHVFCALPRFDRRNL